MGTEDVVSNQSWYVMYWDWYDGRPSLRPLTATDSVTLTQGSSVTLHSIQQVPIDHASRILGVYLSPDVDFSQHIRVMKSKADFYASRITSPKLTAADIRIFHRTIYAPAMKYSLPAIAVDEEVFAPVQSKIMTAILNGLGVSRNIPTAIRHGPLAMGGLDLLDLRTEAGISAVKLLCDSIFAMSETGKMILINLYYSQLEAGIGKPLLSAPAIAISYLTPTWVTSVRQFLFQHNLQIHLTESFEPPLQTQNDQYIMNSEHLSRFTSAEKLDINLVRIYLQAMTLFDLSAGTDGHSICPYQYRGVRHPDFLLRKSWPRQLPPTSVQIRIWQKYLSTSFLRYRTFWHFPLGSLSPLSATPQLSDMLTTPNDPADYSTLKEYLKAIPSSYRRLLTHHEQIASDLEVWRSFRSKSRLEIVTDGGLAENIGTFGWRLIRPPHLILFQGSGPIDGPIELGTSTRSELGGFAAPLLLVAAISRFWGGLHHRCKFRWVVDSTAAISKVEMVTRRGARPRRQPNNVDFLSMISCIHKELRRPLSITWVKGHQDSHPQTSGPLSRDALNNIAADDLATQHRLQRHLLPHQKTPHLPLTRVSITINGLRIHSHFDSMLQYHINGYHLRLDMQRRFSWSDSVWESIDHNTFGQHFRSLTPAQQIPRMKFIHDQQPLGVRLARQSTLEHAETTIAQCPCCRLVVEDQPHFLQCVSNPLTAQALQDFQKTLHTKALHAVYYLFSFGVLQWFVSGVVPVPSEWDLRGCPVHMHALVLDVICDQAKIGWLSGVKGFLSRHWLTLAQQSMDTVGTLSLDVGRGRLRHLLKALFTLTTTIWKDQNERLHGESTSKLTSANRLEDIEIIHYHAQPELLSQSDRHYCERPLALILKSTPTNRRRWLRQVKLARHRRLTAQQSQSQLPQFYHRTSRLPTTSRQPVTLQPPVIVQPPRQTSLLSFLPTILHWPISRCLPSNDLPASPSLPISTLIPTSRQVLITSFLRPVPTRTPDHSPAPLPAPPPRRQSSIMSFFHPRTP